TTSTTQSITTSTTQSSLPCEDKTGLDCKPFVVSNLCNVPTVRINCAKTCKFCSPVHVANGPPIG
ncbi:Hypothetical predicted protein, partial [Mytilus galloprovincialis]